MLNSVKTELKTWFFTGRIILTLALIVAGYVFFAIFGVSSVETKAKVFVSITDSIHEEEKIEKILQEPLFNNDGSANALLKNKMDIEAILCALAPHNALSFCEEVGLYLLPIIMAAIGAWTVCQDCSANVMRIRVSREGKWQYFFAKQAVMIFTVIGLLSIAILIYETASFFFYEKARRLATVKYIDFHIRQFEDGGIGLYQTLFFALCMIIFLEIGFSIGYIFKSSIIPTVLVGFLWYVNIIPLDYGPKNAIYNIVGRLFDFSGFVPGGMTSIIPEYIALSIIMALLILPMIILLVTWRKRSFYK